MDIRRQANLKIASILIWALLLLAAIVYVGPARLMSLYSSLTPVQIRDFLLSFGALAVLAFLAISVIRPVFFIPLTPFTIASGFLFGLGWGLAYALLGSMLSAALVFCLSRYLFQDYVKRKVLGRYPSVDQLIQERGWQFVTFLRLIPVIPFDVVGYLAGASRIRFRPYLLGSILGELPGAAILVLFGASLEKPGSGLFYVSLVLAIALLILPAIARRFFRGSKGKVD